MIIVYFITKLYQACINKFLWCSWNLQITFVPAELFMYLRAILCPFQISVDFYYVPVGGRGGLEKGGARGYCDKT